MSSAEEETLCVVLATQLQVIHGLAMFEDDEEPTEEEMLAAFAAIRQHCLRAREAWVKHTHRSTQAKGGG